MRAIKHGNMNINKDEFDSDNILLRLYSIVTKSKSKSCKMLNFDSNFGI